MNTETRLPLPEQLYRQYRDKISGYIHSRIADKQTAEDLLSTVFLKICENYTNYDREKAAASTWIYIITRNTVYDHFRKEASRGAIIPLDTLKIEPFEEPDPAANLICEETLEELACALEQLPETERDLILLVYYHARSLKEAAEQIGIGYSAAKYHHQAALERLHRYLEG